MRNLVSAALFGLVALGTALALAPSAQAIDVKKQITVPASAAKAWAAVQDFCSLPDWHPAVVGCTLGEMGGLKKRELTLGNDAKIVEVENFHSDKTMTIIYSIVDSPLPLVQYVSTITVTPAGEGMATIGWNGRFAAPDGKDKEARDLIDGFYEAGLQTLAKKLNM